MKKQKFQIGEYVTVVFGGKVGKCGHIETIMRTFGKIDSEGKFLIKKAIPEFVFERLEPRDRVKQIDEITWQLDDGIYKHKDYKYYIRFDNGGVGTTKNYCIKNKEKFEAMLVVERLMKSK